jgi:Lon protease-like protein
MNAPMRHDSLAIFPLTGMLMLPGTYLPLNIFEERYRNMVRDALQGNGVIGMIQPFVPGLDNWGVPPLDLDTPKLYPVGCLGRIDQHELQPDGRYVIVLEGIERFRVLSELEPRNGYRRVEADSSEFAIDRQVQEHEIDTSEVLSILQAYARETGLELDPDLLPALPGDRLVSTLSAALPFDPAEKQALLEAHSPKDRASLLLTLMTIGIGSKVSVLPSPSRIVN